MEKGSKGLNKFDIRVVATDGVETKKILWVRSTTKHISYGFNIPLDVGHSTYHEDGKLHHKSKRGITPINKKQIPLTDFKGEEFLGNFITPKAIESLPYVDFDYKKVNGLVYIDLRTLNPSRNVFNIALQLVEAGKLDLIRSHPYNKSIHIFTFTNPWVVISVG